MPPSLPLVRERSVQDARAPNQYQDSSAATPDAFGAAEGRATATFGQAIQGAGNVLGDYAVKQREEDDARSVLNAKTTLDDRSRAFKFGEDGQGGEFAKQGEQAIGGTKRLAEFYRQTTETLGGTITNPRARLALDKMAAAARDSDLDAMARREADQRIKANTEVATTAAESAKRLAVDTYNDPKVAETSINAGVAAIKSNILGKPQPVIDEAVAKYVSDVHTARIQRAAIDSPAKAAEMYGELKDKIAGDDHIKIEKLLEPAQERARGIVGGQSIIGQPGPTPQRLATVTQGTNLPAIVAATAGAETAGFDARAVSPKGAAGVMQVMPGTARDISRQLGDGLITPQMTDDQVRETLKNPNVGIVYGAQYHAMNLKRFGGDIEAAVVAYNAGPENAEKWLKAGRDYSALPKPQETAPYVRKVMNRYADLVGGGADEQGGAPDVYRRVELGALPRPGTRMTRDNWSLTFYKPEDMVAPTGGGAWVDARAARMADYLGAKFFEQTGIRVPINDINDRPGTEGKRRGTADPEDNPHVAGSQHIHGRAFDFQVQKLTPEQKTQFLTLARQVGFTGVGFYEGGSGHLHLDAGAARSWGGLPAWAGGAMRTAALGQGAIAPADVMGGPGAQWSDGTQAPGSARLPTPGSWVAGANAPTAGMRRVTAGGPTSGTDAMSFLPPALSPEGRGIIGTPVPTSISAAAAGSAFGPGGASGLPPAVPTRVRLPDDYDPVAWRDQVGMIENPRERQAASQVVEREIRAREQTKKNALRDLRANAIRHVQGGGSADNLDPDTYSSLLDLDPKFVTDTLPAMEDRRAKRLDKTDERTFNYLNELPKERLADVDLDQYVDKLSNADRRALGQRQRDAVAGTAEADMRWNGIETRNAIATRALQGVGIAADKNDAVTQARVGLFNMRLQAEITQFESDNKKTPQPKDLNEIIGRLLTPIDASGVFSNKPSKYLFEAGTSDENTRRRNLLDGAAPVGIDKQSFVAANSLTEIPGPMLQTLVDNHVKYEKRQPKPAEAIRLYNDGVAISTGRLPEPPADDRKDIIAKLRRQYGPSISDDTDRLNRLVREMYAGAVRKLFDPVSEPDPFAYDAFAGAPSARPVIPY